MMGSRYKDHNEHLVELKLLITFGGEERNGRKQTEDLLSWDVIILSTMVRRNALGR
jgi:hypothetical protein